MIDRIERTEIFRNRNGQGVSYFHPRATVCPNGEGSQLVMTLQEITGSDYFHGVLDTVSDDCGRSWSTPSSVIPFQWRKVSAEIEEGVCDVVPEYHAASGKVLAMGHNVYYKDGRLFDSLGDFTSNDSGTRLQRFIVYAVWDADGNWSAQRKRLECKEFAECSMFSCGCAQRVTEGDGTIFIPVTFGHFGRADRMVSVLRCSFDGEDVKVEACGDVHELPVGRGLLEPSLVKYRGKYFMTIRAEDDHGYASVSDDGLKWEPISKWCWDNGDFPTMSTTQQRWLVHKDKLYLVYTRRTAENWNVMRWRAPLFIAEVDPDRLILKRDTEQVVFPMVGDGVNLPDDVARMGNFHTTSITPDESIITVGEVLEHHDWRGDTLLARLN